ncbi:hypothetical protein RRG08_013002 [Elysia crispata]|uniref:Uncharacterized protein n=1 Tax=Elysia crispata TaxID=231223 RepID=A0AAE1A173_9GAST|nr:hypothetical protein RRG08_013002 [Elysia crispata]
MSSLALSRTPRHVTACKDIPNFQPVMRMSRRYCGIILFQQAKSMTLLLKLSPQASSSWPREAEITCQAT